MSTWLRPVSTSVYLTNLGGLQQSHGTGWIWVRNANGIWGRMILRYIYLRIQVLMSKIVYFMPVSVRMCILFVACEIILKWIRYLELFVWWCLTDSTMTFITIQLSLREYFVSRHSNPRKCVKVDLQEVDFTKIDRWTWSLSIKGTLSFVLLLAFFPDPNILLSPHPGLKRTTRDRLEVLEENRFESNSSCAL